MQIALQATEGSTGVGGCVAPGRGDPVTLGALCAWSSGRVPARASAAAAGQCAVPFRGAGRADRIGTRAFRRARRRHTQVVFRPGGAPALLYNNGAVRAGNALSPPSRPPPDTPPSGSGAAPPPSQVACGWCGAAEAVCENPHPNLGTEGSRQGFLWLLVSPVATVPRWLYRRAQGLRDPPPPEQRGCGQKCSAQARWELPEWDSGTAGDGEGLGDRPLFPQWTGSV